mmetsp:Transcript_27030/g.46112  ORF Transcript_27030/g.46112 Transcript_27030/m.46112 type:complete len:290 (-) Transcript_27030:209-1078(-)|eukprot:CAMPEP_0183728812 /NCGR_PEP_ID=MMETSP0737-20130205/28974_1 /TAXON_ID=385413 /ORGANISM="Thalassiosira miniscula, Strain CCMP1093" /LENGTH=289 /DNA_ID=CAMNT_0025960841 /DNA_START=164 /DNA_END=1036 /DNA_ORIENTATION=+
MSDDDSSSSEDLPLSALAKSKKEESESSDEAEFEEEYEDEDEGEGEREDGEVGEEPEPDSSDFIDDDDVEDDDEDGDYDSDSSDDVPLTALKSKKTPPKAKEVKSAKKSSTKKAAPKKKASSSAKKKKPTTTKSASSTSNYLCASGELYPQCDKGKLIQSLLARWWYAYEWPDPKDIPDYTPRGYDALDGFPGVYICTQGSNVGKFLDNRDHSKSPSFKNFAKKDSEELKEILLKAIDAQMKDLIEHEGEGTETQKGLRALQKWAMKLNCSKADREAQKVLKAKRLSLP